MKTLEEVLAIMNARLDRATLENYIAREWVRPQQAQQDWYFEEIDIARIQLVSHLAQDIEVNDHGIDVALSLLDQLYGLRAQMRHLTHAITQQPSEVQANIAFIVSELVKVGSKP
jgi:chaperone modulatory protein CbpM